MPGNVHDLLFRSTFSQLEHAASFLRLVLPPALVARLDWGSLTLCPGSFVDEALGERLTDLLFSILFQGSPALLYLLFEHESRSTRLRRA
jgi:predicted transposase YdaD